MSVKFPSSTLQYRGVIRERAVAVYENVSRLPRYVCLQCIVVREGIAKGDIGLAKTSIGEIGRHVAAGGVALLRPSSRAEQASININAREPKPAIERQY